MARKLGRTTSTRMHLLRNLATDLIFQERIETTEAKAKELRSVVEKMITLGKKGDTNARRQAAAFLYKKEQFDDNFIGLEDKARLKPEEKEQVESTLDKLFDELAERYEDRQGGYTRILKLGPRRGDGAKMAIIELVPSENE